jgi:hypothetical protein
MVWDGGKSSKSIVKLQPSRFYILRSVPLTPLSFFLGTISLFSFHDPISQRPSENMVKVQPPEIILSHPTSDLIATLEI